MEQWVAAKTMTFNGERLNPGDPIANFDPFKHRSLVKVGHVALDKEFKERRPPHKPTAKQRDPVVEREKMLAALPPVEAMVRDETDVNILEYVSMLGIDTRQYPNRARLIARIVECLDPGPTAHERPTAETLGLEPLRDVRGNQIVVGERSIDEILPELSDASFRYVCVRYFGGPPRRNEKRQQTIDRILGVPPPEGDDGTGGQEAKDDGGGVSGAETPADPGPEDGTALGEQGADTAPGEAPQDEELTEETFRTQLGGMTKAQIADEYLPASEQGAAKGLNKEALVDLVVSRVFASEE